MSDPRIRGVGAIPSADIAVPEHDRELRFYASVLTTGEDPLWRDDLTNNRGVPIIGLGARTAEHEHLPLQWMPHIQVADVATSVARALELRGSELLHAKDGDGRSQWAVLLDPNGAAFGIIPVASEESIAPEEGVTSLGAAQHVGRICWTSLTVTDALAARDFYRQVVGWSVEDVGVEDGKEDYLDYNLLGNDGNLSAKVCHARGANMGLPPAWLVYLPVGDLPESLRRVREGGGDVIKTTRGTDDTDACAVVRDPVGACLGLVARRRPRAAIRSTS